ncbi:MAG: hypothetical protein WBL48_17360, partial [Pseudolabrys sp.]
GLPLLFSNTKLASMTCPLCAKKRTLSGFVERKDAFPTILHAAACSASFLPFVLQILKRD